MKNWENERTLSNGMIVIKNYYPNEYQEDQNGNITHVGISSKSKYASAKYFPEIYAGSYAAPVISNSKYDILTEWFVVKKYEPITKEILFESPNIVNVDNLMKYLDACCAILDDIETMGFYYYDWKLYNFAWDKDSNNPILIDFDMQPNNDLEHYKTHAVGRQDYMFTNFDNRMWSEYLILRDIQCLMKAYNYVSGVGEPLIFNCKNKHKHNHLTSIDFSTLQYKSNNNFSTLQYKFEFNQFPPELSVAIERKKNSTKQRDIKRVQQLEGYIQKWIAADSETDKDARFKKIYQQIIKTKEYRTIDNIIMTFYTFKQQHPGINISKLEKFSDNFNKKLDGLTADVNFKFDKWYMSDHWKDFWNKIPQFKDEMLINQIS